LTERGGGLRLRIPSGTHAHAQNPNAAALTHLSASSAGDKTHAIISKSDQIPRAPALIRAMISALRARSN